MIQRQSSVLDQYDRPVPGAEIYVYNSVNDALAVLTSDGVTPLAQPIETDPFGVYSYWADTGVYLEEVRYGGKLRYREAGIGIGSPSPPTEAVATRTALADVTGMAAGNARRLSEAGREGTFQFDSSNLSAQVTADTAQGVYVSPTSASTGASGAWVRKFSGKLNASWFGFSTAATGAANKTAWDAAVAYHLYSGIPLDIPAGTFNVTGAPRVDANYFNIQGSNWGKTILKPTSATEGIIITGRYFRLAHIGFDGSVAGTYGIVARNCSFGVIEECTARSFDNDGLLLDPTYGGGAQGNNDGLRVVGGEYNSNGGCGVRMLTALDNNIIGFYGVNASGNASHGFLLRGHGGYIDPICLAEGNVGYGLQIGEDGDTASVEGWRIDAPHTEGNTLGGIYGSALSVNNLINIKSVGGIQGYSRHATSANSVGVITNGAARFGSNDGVVFAEATGSTNDMFLRAVHNAGGNVNLNLAGAGTGWIDLQDRVHVTDGGNALAQLNIRPNSSKTGVVSYTHAGVADRWSHGIKTGDSSFYFGPNADLATSVADLSAAGALNVSVSYKIAGTKVLGAQGAAVADPAALTSVNATNAVGVPTQAEFNAFVAEFNKLRTDLTNARAQLVTALARLRAATGHGLIA